MAVPVGQPIGSGAHFPNEPHSHTSASLSQQTIESTKKETEDTVGDIVKETAWINRGGIHLDHGGAPPLLSPAMHACPPTSRPPLSVHHSRTRTNRRCRHRCKFHRRRGPELAILNQCRREYPTIIVGVSAVAFATVSILRGRKTRTLMNLVIGGGFAQVGVSYLEIQDRKAKRG